MLSPFENAQRLFRSGHYLDILRDVKLSQRDLSALKPAHRILIAHTLLQTGEVQRAVEQIDRELELDLSPALRSQCELIKGLACRHHAEISKALHHYQLSVQYARQDQDYLQLIWASVQRFRLLAELYPSDELAPMVAELRQLSIKAGDAQAVAYMHYAVALMEASNGRISEARRHLTLSQSLLIRYPNAWLEQLNFIAIFVLDFLDCDYREGLANLERARDLLPITGSRERTLIDCNEAHALLVTGKFKSATERFRTVLQKDTGLARLGAMEGLARAYLSAGKLAECEDTLDAHDALIAQDKHLAAAFTGRWTTTTRVRLLLKKRDFSAAAECTARYMRRTVLLKDRVLRTELSCLHADALNSLGREDEAARSLLRLDLESNGESVGQLATYYYARGRVAAQRNNGLSNAMFERALRIWRSEGNECALSEFSDVGKLVQPSAPPESIDSKASLIASTLAAAVMLAHKPRLLAAELTAAIEILGCSPKVRLVGNRGGAAVGDSDDHCVIPVGGSPGITWSLMCEIPQEPLKAMALGDVARVGAAAIAVQRRFEDAKNRAALWPASPVEDEAGALFTGEQMQQLLTTVRRVAATNVSVLLTGETGTGKEVLARTIHGYSNRAKGPFLPFNCTSTPRDMLDSQLFGHRRGAFTGATENFPGVIRAAAGGTLFLDEIGDMPLDMQPKLLRFLESNEVHPIGETQPVRVDVRVVAATNADLDTLVADGRFRADLFYRLNIVRLHLPPLRERRMEIPALAQHYLQKYAQEYGKGDLRLAEETMEYLLLYRWPGNIRQLANEMRRMAALSESSAVLMPEHLSLDIAASRRTVPPSERILDLNEVVVRLDQPLAAATEHLERAMLLYALKQCRGRIEETASLLGVSRKGLYLKRQRFGIEPPETPSPMGTS
jgi:DNA-binding NtrC family response regulator/tetratricopeptide (TPR) repeat protein